MKHFGGLLRMRPLNIGLGMPPPAGCLVQGSFQEAYFAASFMVHPGFTEGDPGLGGPLRRGGVWGNLVRSDCAQLCHWGEGVAALRGILGGHLPAEEAKGRGKDCLRIRCPGKSSRTQRSPTVVTLRLVDCVAGRRILGVAVHKLPRLEIPDLGPLSECCRCLSKIISKYGSAFKRLPSLASFSLYEKFWKFVSFSPIL